MPSAGKYELSFFTATILQWKHLLANDRYKEIITGSLSFLVEKKRVYVHAFVIMDNHLHLLWHIIHPNKREDVQRDFLKFTSQMIIKDLRNNDPELLNDFFVGAKDRKYQVWERDPLTVDLWSHEVLKQKLEYIHNNPVKAGLCGYPEKYKYSSAAFYNGLENSWQFVTHYM